MSLGVCIFNLLRAIVIIIIMVIRGCFFVIENENEINISMIWASSLSMTILLIYMLVYRLSFTFTEFLNGFTILNILSGLFTCLSFWKGEIRKLKESINWLNGAFYPGLIILFLSSLKIFTYNW